MTSKQAKQQAAKRAEMKKLGKVERRVWVYPQCAEKARAAVERINNAHEKVRGE